MCMMTDINVLKRKHVKMDLFKEELDSFYGFLKRKLNLTDTLNLRLD